MAFVLAIPALCAAQTVPSLSGAVRIDLSAGALAADVCLSGVPIRGDTLSIVLNRAYTIRRLTGANLPPAMTELEPGGAAIRYTLVGGAAGSPAEAANGTASVCLEYGGAHPVFDVAAGDYGSLDASSTVAFNGSTVRARGASRWHPAPFDRASGLATDALTFDLTVDCAACERIYVNGGPPAPGPRARFTADAPREILLVAGDLPLTEIDGTLFLGQTASADTAAAFLETLSAIQDFYADYLGIPFGPRPDILLLDPLQEPRRGRFWAFFSDPAFVILGTSVTTFVEVLAGPPSPARMSVFGFLAHELAHRYFGWSIGSDSLQRDLFGEPFATFLELKALRHFFGDATYSAAVEALLERNRSTPPPTPLDAAGPDDLASESYRYTYAPLLLLTLEHAIGDARMRALLRALLQTPSSTRRRADFDLIRQAALTVGVSPDEWSRWEELCVRTQPTAGECLGGLHR